MKAKSWLAGWFVLVATFLGMVGYQVYKVDPFFHYHKPDTDTYFYTLNNERSQNDGITKHFEYDALITGTSMTENFSTSEMDSVFGTSSIKVPYSGGSYKEINDNLKVALSHNPNLKIIVRCLDMGSFFNDKDVMRFDLGEYPTYLYDSNPFNDVEYLFNRDIIWNRVYPMTTANDAENFTPGITSFDAYARWQYSYTFGINTVLPNGVAEFEAGTPVHLTEEERETIRGNIRQNVTSLAEEYPDVEFYYFFSPYSIAWWQSQVSAGTIYKQLEAEQYIIEQILETENIHLFSFNDRFDIIADLNNYKDASHYGMWVNILMLHWMHEGKYRLTKENYPDYLEKESAFYLSFDYLSLNGQEDYENDFFADALFHEEMSGTAPTDVLQEKDADLHLANAEITGNGHDGKIGIQCMGSLWLNSDEEYSLEESKYVGACMDIGRVDDYKYLVFWGKKISGCGAPTVMLFDEQGEKAAELSVSDQEMDDAWHQYLIDVSGINGALKAVFHGGGIIRSENEIADVGEEDAEYNEENAEYDAESTERADSGYENAGYVFSDIMLY